MYLMMQAIASWNVTESRHLSLNNSSRGQAACANCVRSNRGQTLTTIMVMVEFEVYCVTNVT